MILSSLISREQIILAIVYSLFTRVAAAMEILSVEHKEVFT